MKNTVNELDSYLMLKYGYPLTAEAYNSFPDDLIRSIYRKRFSATVFKEEDVYLMRSVIVEDIELINYRFEYWTKADEIYNIIKMYHESHN